MKNFLKGMAVTLAGASLLTGCSTMDARQGTDKFDREATDPVGEAEIVRAQIPLRVVDASLVQSSSTRDLCSLVESQLAGAGFAVKDADPFVTVRLSTRMTPFSSLGNYKVYEAGCGISVTRADSQVLFNEQVSVKGERKLEEGRAVDSAEEKLAAVVGQMVANACAEKTTGVESMIVTFNRKSESSMTSFSRAMRKKPGILSCRRIKEAGRMAEYRVVFDAREYPDGITRVLKQAMH